MRKLVRALLLPVIFAATFIAVAPSPASAATTDPVLSASDDDHYYGKYANATATYTRHDNRLHIVGHAHSPYLFAGARATFTVTLFADTPFGPYPVWQEVRNLTACGVWDPTCPETVDMAWDAYPSWDKLQQVKDHASFIRVETVVR